jgi:membrane-bound lytic murein transglycosylase F
MYNLLQYIPGRFFPVLLVLAILTSCDRQKAPGDELIVLTRNAPTTWYEGQDGLAGPEHDLIVSFADFQKWKVRFIIKDSIREILQSIQEGEGDIAAAGLTRTEAREANGMIFGPDYFEVQQQVVCRRHHGKTPQSPAELVGKKIAVISASSYEESLREIQKEYPEIRWESVEDVDTEQLLEEVWQKKIDCTLADSNIVSINRRYFPELVIAFAASEVQSLAWIVNPNEKQLTDNIEKWLDHAGSSGELAQINERYYGHVEIFDYVDMSKFQRRISERLPKYRKIFESVAAKHNFPWTLIAAQAYQESHWNPRAKSPTGVRGMMMLTQATASSVGVKKRLDPLQSIEGGVRYLEKMLNRLPEEVQGEDRIWFALAAYNVGLGHLRDARILAVRQKRNPNLWLDIQEMLPLLSKKAYYKTVPHGYARGTEPVQYVDRIRSYYEVLEQHLANTSTLAKRPVGKAVEKNTSTTH